MNKITGVQQNSHFTFDIELRVYDQGFRLLSMKNFQIRR